MDPEKIKSHMLHGSGRLNTIVYQVRDGSREEPFLCRSQNAGLEIINCSSSSALRLPTEMNSLFGCKQHAQEPSFSR